MSTTTSTYALIKHARGDTPWDVEVNADLDTIDAEIARPRLPFNSPTVGATTTCDLALARVFVFTVSQATTLAFTNVPTSSFACRIRLLITNGSAFVLTFPASVTWLSGIAPSFKASGVDEVELLTKDGGTTWYATLRNLRPGVIYQNQGLSTTSTSDVSLASYTLPASTLAVNGQALRITVIGRGAATNACTINIKFGSFALANLALAAAGDAFVATMIVTRTGAATQLAVSSIIKTAAGTATAQTAAPTLTLSGTVLIDFRGQAGVASTLSYDYVGVELLAAA